MSGGGKHLTSQAPSLCVQSPFIKEKKFVTEDLLRYRGLGTLLRFSLQLGFPREICLFDLVE